MVETTKHKKGVNQKKQKKQQSPTLGGAVQSPVKSTKSKRHVPFKIQTILCSPTPPRPSQTKHGKE